MVKQIDRHVLAAILGPCTIIFAIALAGLVLEETIRLANAILEDQAPADALIGMLLYLLPEYVALSLPVSFLLGVFFGFRMLNLQNTLAIYYSGGALLRLSRRSPPSSRSCRWSSPAFCSPWAPIISSAQDSALNTAPTAFPSRPER